MNKYITKEDYLKEKGTNLDLEIQNDDNKSNKVKRFIKEVTDWCIDYLTDKYDCDELLGEFNDLKEFRQDYFRKGVIEQIEYILDEGWINKDAGLIRELGTIVDFSKVSLGRTAYLKFKRGAFCNIVRY